MKSDYVKRDDIISCVTVLRGDQTDTKAQNTCICYTAEKYRFLFPFSVVRYDGCHFDHITGIYFIDLENKNFRVWIRRRNIELYTWFTALLLFCHFFIVTDLKTVETPVAILLLCSLQCYYTHFMYIVFVQPVAIAYCCLSHRMYVQSQRFSSSAHNTLITRINNIC